MAQEWIKQKDGTFKRNPKYKKKQYVKKDDGTFEIAPVRKVVEDAPQSNERTWFKKSEGGIWDTILGSSADAGENAGTGLIGLGEKMVDGFMALGSAMNNQKMMETANDEVMFNAITGRETKGVLEKYQNIQKDVEKGAEEFIVKDLYDERKIIDNTLGKMNKSLGIDTDANSIFGAKSDSLAQSAGQLAGQILLNPIVPWYVTTGASSMGSQTESALQEGATFDKAVASGLITAGADILTEKLFGGSGLGEKGLINLEPLTKGITNKVVKSLADFGVDVLAEGSEEVIAGVMSNLGSSLYKEENLSEILLSEEAIDGYIESFIGGAVLGGGANAVNVGKSIKNKTDYRTGVTENEQKILDKAVEQRIKEAEQGGKKLSKQEKTEIEQDVLNSLQRGEIDIDTIEREFGGESYTAFESLKKESDEFSTLYETPSEKLSEKQKDRLAELKAKNTENSYENRLFEARSKLTQDVQKVTEKDGFIREAYGEKTRKSEAFKVSEEESKKYSEKEMKIVNKAVESGIINNTRKSHDLVNLIAKLHNDKNVDFDFANNEKLKESGFAIEGKTIDGFKQGNSVTINLQSKKALNTVVGHEITHVLEGTDMYQALQKTVIEYAKAQGVYDAKYKDIVHLYRNQFQDNDLIKRKALYDGEVTADLVGEYIFSDMDFVRNLSTKNPNVFQKVYNEIKYMLKVATAGSDAEKQLLKAKKIFEDVYRDTKTNTSEDVQFSLQNSNITKDTKIPIVESTDYTVVPEKDYNALYTLQSDVKKLQRGTYENKASGYKADINAKTISKILHPSTNFDPWHGHYVDNLNASKHLPALFENAVYVDTKENQKSKNANKEVEGFHHFVAPIRMNGNDYRVRITAREKTNSNTLYIVDAEVLQKNKGNVVPNAKANGNISTLPSEMSIADLVNGVNIFDYNLQKNQTYTDKDIQFAVSDNKGRTLTEATQNFLVDSKIRDENGNIKAMYHGSPAQFTVFNKKKAKSSGYYGKGFYFTESESHASQYGNIFEVYLNIKNPLQGDTHNITKEQLRKFVEEVSNNEDYGIENYGYDATVDSVTDSVYGKDDFAMLQDINATSIGDMVEAVELFNKVNGTNYDGIVAPTETVAFYPQQIKSVTNQHPTDNPDINFSLSDQEQSIAPIKNGIYSEDVLLDIAPLREDIAQTHDKGTETNSIAPDVTGMTTRMRQEEIEMQNEMFPPMTEEDAHNMLDSDEDWDRLRKMQEAEEPQEDIDDTVYPMSDTARLSEADLREVRKSIQDKLPLQRGRTQAFNDIVQRYSTSEYPNSDALFYEIKDNFGKVTISEEISDVAEVQKILKNTRINVSENIKNGVTDYVQTMRRNSFKMRFSKDGMPVDVAYQELSEMYPNMFPEDITNEVDQFEQLVSVANMMRTETGEFEVDNETIYDTVNSIVNTVRDIRTRLNQNTAERRARWFDKDRTLEEYMQTDDFAELEGNPNLLKVFQERWDRNRLGTELPQVDETTAQILDSEPQAQKKGFRENVKRKWAVFKANFVDKGAVFEDLSKVTKNRNIEAKWDYTMLSDAQAQNFMQNGDDGSKSLESIREEVNNTGFSKEFSEYMYHYLNIDRMTLDARYGIENKTVFGQTVTADVSKQKVSELESAHPEFKAFAQDVYNYMNELRGRLVKNGVLSQETADLWAEMYPHYVPIRRVDSKGLNVNVPLATNRTGVNAPIKKATGGNSDILPLFDTMAQRTMQTFKAINKNDFGIELKNALGSTIGVENSSIDGVIDMVESQDALLKAGENGYNPTFTVFENGKRVTFEITQEMYEALLPMSEKMRDSGSKILQTASAFHRGVLTQYNPVFALTNGIKDAQDILINSQHPLKTYSKVVEATQQLLNKGQWYQEYMKQGGGDNTYFDTDTNEIAPVRKGISKVLDTFPLKQINNLNEFIERVPRLAEYIASREMGRSVQESMLDASRVTTNFKAGGDWTKFINKNGATFLNASVQGVAQQVRNVREANMNGLKGWGMLATKFAIAGLPALLLNHLIWDDDEEYEELSDYVKQNYYVIGKTEDGHFIRIPKGRALAVIQEAVNQVDKMATGDDEADLKTFLDVLKNNLAPNNPFSNNVLAPIRQAITNTTWYGGDLVPQNLQDLPSAEQYDESTDSISKKIGETFNISPMKVNYLLDQYTGLVGDMILPALTPEVTSGTEGALGYAIAPLKDKFMTDGVMNKQVITDFYDKSEELTKTANKSTATSEDVLKNKYLNSIKAEMNDLYKQKRELQNSDLSNKEKYEQVREVQRQISELAKEGMNNYENVEVQDYYATVGDRQYRWYQQDDEEEGSWKKLDYKQIARQEKVIARLGITPAEYWSNRKEEYDYAYDYPGKYGIAKAVGGYDSYVSYNKDLNKIKPNKDAYGQSINNSKKANVVQYINNLNADYYTKIMLMKKEYPGDDTYNKDIVEYLNGREDISYQEMVDILTELDFKVSSDGTIRW